MPDDTKKRRIRLRPSCGGPWCVCDCWDGVEQMIDGDDDGLYEIQLVIMSDAEVEALGEFGGW